MNIIRVEHKITHLGPWRHPYPDTDLAHLVLHRLDSDRREWPGPGEDGIDEQLLRYTDGWRFGFESDASLLKWFNQRDLELLHGMGFHGVSFDVHEIPRLTVMRGEHQVAFRWYTAKKVCDVNLLGYL